jgi:hypothetical protein
MYIRTILLKLSHKTCANQHVDKLIRQISEDHDIQHLPRIFSIVDIQVQLVHLTKHPIFMDIHFPSIDIYRTKHTLNGPVEQ